MSSSKPTEPAQVSATHPEAATAGDSPSAPHEQLLNFTEDMLALLDTDFRFVAVNASYCHLFDKPKAFFIGRTLEQVFAHDPVHYHDVVEPLLLQCREGKDVYFERWVNVPAFGDLFMEVQYHPFLDANGNIEGIVVVGRDRTEVTNSIEALKRNENLLNRTERIANLGGWFVDIATGEMQWTDEMYEIHEVGRDFVVTPENVDKFIPPEDFGRVQLDLQKALSGTPTSLVSRLITAKGNNKWVRSISFPVLEDGKVVSIEGVLQDITDQMEMQSGMNKALRSLETQKYILDQHAIVTTTDRHGNITYVNEKFCEITGYLREEVLGQNHRLIKSGLHSQEFYRQLWSTISAGRVWQGEICNKALNGDLFWVHTTIVPLKDESGNIEEFIAVRTNITELKRTEETLRRAHKMEAIGQLSGGIAHDFNNLLSIVIGNIELAELMIPKSNPARMQLENARNAALRGSVLTRRLLNFSLQAPIQGKTVVLNTILQGIEMLISKSLTALVKVDMQLDAGLWPTEVDAGDFEDAIINLVINASDAMPDGGKLTFTTRNQVIGFPQYRGNVLILPGSYVELEIADTGTGMQPEILEKIFEPYFSTKPSDKGSGLGLAMVYGFVKRSKGLIYVESAPGAGATFTILLPKSLPAALETIAVASSATGETRDETKSETGKETILLVDDEADIVRISERHLKNIGYRVLSCTSTEEALSILGGDEIIDLLFTDIVMPGKLNGFELAEEALMLRPDLKVLFTTGYVKAQEKASRAQWLNRIVQKPYRTTEISHRIREVLDDPLNPARYTASASPSRS